MAEPQVGELPRRDSVNGYVYGYVYEYDESLASVKEIERTHQQRVDWWRAKLAAAKPA